jgi:hypothetical protein
MDAITDNVHILLEGRLDYRINRLEALEYYLHAGFREGARNGQYPTPVTVYARLEKKYPDHALHLTHSLEDSCNADS